MGEARRKREEESKKARLKRTNALVTLKTVAEEIGAGCEEAEEEKEKGDEGVEGRRRRRRYTTTPLLCGLGVERYGTLRMVCVRSPVNALAACNE